MTDVASVEEKVAALKAKMWKKQFFVMHRRIVDPARLKPVMFEHYQWIIGLEKQGKVFLSGPVAQRDGRPGVGMTIFLAGSWEEAQDLAAGDPFVTAGAADFTLGEWQINEGRLTIQVDLSDMSSHVD